MAETFGVGKKDPGGFRGEVSATAAHDAGERRGGLELEP